ncbi:hypothetical protein DFS33DRAFT_881524 [Desarmillaria ectypa]|nr:hypothetical protein DFS33DRAFT_881524 [Desarmillaria ectypa]
MISTHILFLAAGIFATEVYAISSPSPRNAPTSIGPLLFSRQFSNSAISSIPSQCANSCSIVDTIVYCADNYLDCACTNADSDLFAECLDCLVRYDNSLKAEAQQEMNSYVDLCKQVGITIKSQKINSTGRITIGAGVIGVVLITVLAVL